MTESFMFLKIKDHIASFIIIISSIYFYELTAENKSNTKINFIP